MSKTFVEEPKKGVSYQKTGGIKNNKGHNLVLYRDEENPSILIDNKNGNIDIRDKKGFSLIQIDAEKKKFFVRQKDLLSDIEAINNDFLKKTELKEALEKYQESILENIGEKLEAMTEKITKLDNSALKVVVTRCEENVTVGGTRSDNKKTDSKIMKALFISENFRDNSTSVHRINGKIIDLHKHSAFYQKIINPSVSLNSKLSKLGIKKFKTPEVPFPGCSVFRDEITISPLTVWVDPTGNFEITIKRKLER